MGFLQTNGAKRCDFTSVAEVIMKSQFSLSIKNMHILSELTFSDMNAVLNILFLVCFQIHN